MGNRTVITTDRDSLDVAKSDEIGVYLHWNGGRDSVEAFLAYCKLKNYRKPEEDNYGWARLCQVIGNFFGGSTSIGIDRCCRLGCKNGDNGVYIIKDWEIVGRRYMCRAEQNIHDLFESLVVIDNAQPESERVGMEAIKAFVEKRKPFSNQHQE